MDDDSFLDEEEGESEGELVEEEGEEEVIEIPKYIQLGFDNDQQYAVVKEEFQFFDEPLSGTINKNDVEKLLRVLLSTKNKVFTAPMPVIEEPEEEVKIEVKIEEHGEDEEDVIVEPEPEPEPEPEEDEKTEPEEEKEISLDEFCILLNQIKKYKKIDRAEKKLTEALRFFDKENRKVVDLRECMEKESFDDIPLPESKLSVSEFLQKAKDFNFITHETLIPESEEEEEDEEVEKKRFEIEEYLDDPKEVLGGESDSESEGEDDVGKEDMELFERRKAKLFQSQFYLEYVYLPKKATKESLRMKIENSLMTRDTRLTSKVKALDEEKQMSILDFIAEYDFLNEERFVGVKSDVTLEDNHFIFRDDEKNVEMMILKDYKLFYKLDQFVCKFFLE